MFQQPGYFENVSMRLSEVLAEIGVDQRVILKRRRTYLLKETLTAISFQIYNLNHSSSYFLGSMSEGTTTLGLDSDNDILICVNHINVMQDLADWKVGVFNYLMIQDETVSPGYCLLQLWRYDAPLPFNNVPNGYHFRDRAGRILLKNTFIFEANDTEEGLIRHGPAFTEQGRPGICDNDFVCALPCKSWPLQANQWLDQQGIGQWPSCDMKRYCRNTGCSVVAVGSKGSENEELEWRISTTLAERCLMFNLNMTQIRCYVLMKMILKTYIKPHFEDTISSFMCKTVLFHCIANTHYNIWRENNLLVCVTLCQQILYNSILNENCPHFIIPRNNLMRGHISNEHKPSLLLILQRIINNGGTALLGIECDELGERLQLKMSYLLSDKTSDIIAGHLLQTTADYIHQTIWLYRLWTRNSSYEEDIQALLTYIFKLVWFSYQCQGVEKTVCCLLVPRFCTTLGSLLASFNIQQYNAISPDALKWISLGLNTDVSSGKLKLASILYCIGDTERAEYVLRDTEANYDLNTVEPICKCYDFLHQPTRREFNAIADNHNEEALQYIAAFCVIFQPCEINCVPSELRYEVFRSTEEDLAFRGIYDYWMDCFVVDSLPYLYFLQYKTYSHLGRQEDKKRALSKLARTIDQEPNLGHRETALNLLGQCMEQEDRARDAFQCYLISLNLRERNNSAKFHICRLLSNMINNQIKKLFLGFAAVIFSETQKMIMYFVVVVFSLSSPH